MLRAILILALLQLGCKAIKDYKTIQILDSKFDQNGTIIYQKTRQLFKSYDGDEYVITYKEYDFKGRVTKRYGFQTPNPNYKAIKYLVGPYDKYLIESHYEGNHEYLQETYVWPINTDSNFNPSPQFLIHQVFEPDSIRTYNGRIEIYIMDHKDSITSGEYRKFKVTGPYRFDCSEWYLFDIPTSKIKFGPNGIFDMTDVKKTFVFQ